jgi:hypothetical protein
MQGCSPGESGVRMLADTYYEVIGDIQQPILMTKKLVSNTMQWHHTSDLATIVVQYIGEL